MSPLLLNPFLVSRVSTFKVYRKHFKAAGNGRGRGRLAY